MAEICTNVMRARALLADEWREAPIEIIDYIVNQMQHELKIGIYQKLDVQSGYWYGLMIESGDTVSSEYSYDDIDDVLGKYDARSVVDISTLGGAEMSADGELDSLYLVNKNVLLLCCSIDDGTRLHVCQVILRGPAKIWVKTISTEKMTLLSIADGVATKMMVVGEKTMHRSPHRVESGNELADIVARDSTLAVAKEKTKVARDLWKFEIDFEYDTMITFVSNSGDTGNYLFEKGRVFAYKLVDDDLLVVSISGDMYELWFD